MDLNSISLRFICMKRWKRQIFHLDIKVFDRYGREVRTGLLQVVRSWISRIDSHLSAGNSSEIESSIIDALS